MDNFPAIRKGLQNKLLYKAAGKKGDKDWNKSNRSLSVLQASQKQMLSIKSSNQGVLFIREHLLGWPVSVLVLPDMHTYRERNTVWFDIRNMSLIVLSEMSENIPHMYWVELRNFYWFLSHRASLIISPLYFIPEATPNLMF